MAQKRLLSKQKSGDLMHIPSGVKDVDACVDADSLDAYDPTYSHSILQHNFSMETKYVLSAVATRAVFQRTQNEITPHMHSTLVDWLLDATSSTIEHSALCLGVHIMDDCLNRASVPRSKFQLLGCACILLAAKLEQIKVPSIADFVSIADRCFNRENMISMEQLVLDCINFETVRPTRVFFLNRLLLVSRIDGGDKKPHDEPRGKFRREESLARMLLDVTLQNYSFNQFRMSLVAAAIMHLTHQYTRTVGEPVWSATMQYYSHYSEKELYPVVERIAAHHYSLHTSGFMSVLRKYNKPAHLHCSTSIVAVPPQQLRFDGACRGIRSIGTSDMYHSERNVGICHSGRGSAECSVSVRGVATCTPEPCHDDAERGRKSVGEHDLPAAGKDIVMDDVKFMDETKTEM
eukprot:CAMPEP_0185028868 /NCGR_PEP_ID=MMETSP1103-20130426/14929_1 /TAXON_ID=36769 /ORGANISM="Paraphysomonas bandaiensis, Strain Caron Lab Isolate" /LENGTH=404 /DNA_ID=CAMNT_0027563431 /DNA_START=234 /DNA_END=1448 /DNA_ORIENTATION=-